MFDKEAGRRSHSARFTCAEDDLSRLLDEADSPRLCFDSQDDAINYARAVTQEFNSRLAELELPNIVEAYRNGGLELCVRLNSRNHPGNLYFAVHAFPRSGVQPNAWPAEAEVARVQYGANEGLMFVDVRELVESVEGFIPSRVWLKRDHQVEDLAWNVLGGSRPSTAHLRFVVTEGKVGVLGIEATSRCCNGKSKMVQRGAEILDCVGSKASNAQGDWLTQLQELEPMAWIKRICLNHQFIGLTLDEGAQEFVDSVNVSFRVIENGARTGEKF